MACSPRVVRRFAHPNVGPPVDPGVWVSPEANVGSSLLIPRQPRQRALIGLEGRAGDGGGVPWVSLLGGLRSF